MRLLSGICSECGKRGITLWMRCEATIADRRVVRDIEVCVLHSEGWRTDERKRGEVQA